MKQFEIGKRYECRSICDWECVWSYVIVARTNKMVTIKGSDGETKRCRVSIYNNTEEILPLGRYSMCPRLSADKLAN